MVVEVRSRLGGALDGGRHARGGEARDVRVAREGQVRLGDPRVDRVEDDDVRDAAVARRARRGRPALGVAHRADLRHVELPVVRARRVHVRRGCVVDRVDHRGRAYRCRPSASSAATTK